MMEAWYKIVTPRKEVREGRSFNPDEFAIALEQVVAGTAPEDYRDPVQFFARTCWTRALREHVQMVLRRLAGRTDDTAPVLTLITQFGGGKTHTLTTLYHLARSGPKAGEYSGVADLLQASELACVPEARVAVFVGNAWDPQEGRETPWIDIARQLAGDLGVQALGSAALDAPPGTEALARVFQAANAPVLILFDEVLNFVNRHRHFAEPFHAFIQNLTVAMTGTTCGAAVISLPRSQVEMTDWDLQWQERITKVVRRVARDLIANDEAEISEVVRRRLFEDLGDERMRRRVAKAFADWCFERRAQLPPEWTAVDAAATESRARTLLQQRFESSYPFHPATLSVFQRKWQALVQYQQTRGTLAMLAQWIAWAYRDGFTQARREPLLTLGSAPLHDPAFRSTILGQLGDARLLAAIETDVAGEHSHARALDAGTSGVLRDIHRRVGATILFESSGGQTDRVAHLPELRFALGEPGVDTTSIDNAAIALEERAYFIRRVGSDGFKIGYQPTLRKVVNDRRASLDEETEIKPSMRKLVESEFRRGAQIPIVPFPKDGSDIPDNPKLTLVLIDPEIEWSADPSFRQQLAEWTRQRGKSPRLYPAALIWCVKKPGRDLQEKVELMLAWERVAAEVAEGILGSDFDPRERAEISTKVKQATEAAKDEVWGGYRFIVIYEPGGASDGLKVIDLGAGHSSSGETLCGRIIATLKTEGLLSETVGAGYIERHWPPTLKEAGAWPLASFRQSFLNGSLTRLLDPDAALRSRIVDFVSRGEFGFAQGAKPDGTYERIWFQEVVPVEEIAFDSESFLLTKAKAQRLKEGEAGPPQPPMPPLGPPTPEPPLGPSVTVQTPAPEARKRTIRLVGVIPPEVWNRLGTRLVPKLRSGTDLKLGIDLSVTVGGDIEASFVQELGQILGELEIGDKLRIERED
jgi:hypothetical protein